MFNKKYKKLFFIVIKIIENNLRNYFLFLYLKVKYFYFSK
jgi:hypothetical protein